MSLTDSILGGDRRSLARLITQIENERPEARPALAALHAHTGRAYLVGVTGAPGTGKSTLVSETAKAYRRLGQTVAIVAVDPTSPFTGGAILGDRIRMRDLSGDPGVFIRSMATRGSLGGLARATADVTAALDAAGFNIIFVETVGAGQAEVDIAGLAHTTLVVEAPGLGDDVQALKAGILEIADVLVVNKADQPGAEAAVRALRGMLTLAHPQRRELFHHHGSGVEAVSHARDGDTGAAWETPICETVATEGKGIEELLAAIDSHRAYLTTSGELAGRTRARIRRHVESLLREQLYARFLNGSSGMLRVDDVVEAVINRTNDPYSAVEELLK